MFVMTNPFVSNIRNVIFYGMDCNNIFLINEEQHKYCYSCTDLLSVKKFGVNVKNPSGYMLRCLACERKRRKEKNDKSKVVFMTSDEILTGMNYDITGDIHQQFCDRYNLPYKEKVIE
jgi:hypothetical protein